MAEAGVSLLLETLRDLLVEESRFLLGVRGEVKGLQTKLEEIRCLLRDADKKQHESETVRNWIVQTRGLAYRAEDVILEYAVRMSSDGRRRGLKRLLSMFACHSLHQLGSEISDIKSEISRVVKSMQDYGIRSIIDGAESPTASDNRNWVRKTFPNFEIEDCFVGKEDDLKRLECLLLEDERHRVISVWGMGGIGKTTIARKVYNHMIERGNDRFESFAWVCVTQQCRIRSVLEDVLRQLDLQIGEGISSLSDSQLVEKLCEIQRVKRCMIVLDDLWETSHWDGMKHAFLALDLKSKILVTTRKQKVAEIGFSQELGLLNVDDGWELLKKKAFPLNDIPEFALNEDLKRIGEEIVRKCGCLPLAISLLGGVLSKKSCVEEWELVNENINASLYRSGGGDNQIDGVIKLSYEDLPYYLKPCFLYFGRLREDESIYSYDLYRMWIAQGMIAEDHIQGNETLTDIAELYLTELASRSIVQAEAEDVIPLQKHRGCKLHDVVREWCLSMGTKEGFGVKILEYEGGKFDNLLQEAWLWNKTQTRHLVIHVKAELELQCKCNGHARDAGKNLRSLEILSHVQRKIIEFPPQSVVDFSKYGLLRGLVIGRFKFDGGKLPRGITDLVHLRYLGLRFCVLDSIPSSISKLAYLDTLDLLGSSNVRLPDHVLKKMTRLKHLRLPSYKRKTIGNYRLKLDEGVDDQLESLIGYDSLVHELKSTSRMRNLRRFSAVIRDNESLPTIVNAIATEWRKLSYCTVLIKKRCELTSEEGVRNLKQAFSCPHLCNLRIKARLGRALEECRSEIMRSKIVKLSLFESEMEEDPMGILGGLPSLRELYLNSRSFVGEEMRAPACSFPRLKKLVLENLGKLREWRVEEGAMAIATEICLRGCPRLERIPDGLRGIATLKKLEITRMEELGRRVEEEKGVDFHKVRHIPSIIIKSSQPPLLRLY